MPIPGTPGPSGEGHWFLFSGTGYVCYPRPFRTSAVSKTLGTDRKVEKTKEVLQRLLMEVPPTHQEPPNFTEGKLASECELQV